MIVSDIYCPPFICLIVSIARKEEEGKEGGGEMGFWSKLQKNHPVLYEVIQNAILLMAIVALILSFVD